MIDASKLRDLVTFQEQEESGEWKDTAKARAYITGLKNSEYWEQYAGGNADQNLTVSVRYKPCLMALIPQTSRLIFDGNIYDIISPPDDVLLRHAEIKFRVRRQIS